MKRFLAVHDIPRDLDEDRLRVILEEVAETSSDLGIRPVETIYSFDAGRAFTLFDADTEEHVREVHEGVDLPVREVLPVDRVFTELLHVSQRERWS